MTSPLVSVLTTVYNREKYLTECIESVLVSSFREFEYIIVDDDSTDRSYEIARDYAQRDSRIRVYRNHQNLGDYPNRNQAASYARGKYLKYVDSDDVIYPHGLQTMVECMRAFPEAGLGLSRPAGDMRYPACLRPKEAYARHFLGEGLFSNASLSAIIPRRCFEETGGFSGKRFVGDTDLWLRLARRYSVVIMPMGLTWWRSHYNQEMAYEVATRAAIAARFQLNCSALEHRDCPLNEEQRRLGLRGIRAGHAWEILLLVRHGHIRDAWGIFTASRLGVPEMWRGLVANVLNK